MHHLDTNFGVCFVRFGGRKKILRVVAGYMSIAMRVKLHNFVSSFFYSFNMTHSI